MATTYEGKADDVQLGRAIRPELRVLDTIRDDKGGLTIYWEDGSNEHFTEKKVDKLSKELLD